MEHLDNVLQFRGNVRKEAFTCKLDFSNVSQEAVENVFVAKAVIIFQDKIARKAEKEKTSVRAILDELPDVIDMGAYVNDYRARTDKEAGVSSFERMEKSIDKLDKDKLLALAAKIQKQLDAATAKK